MTDIAISSAVSSLLLIQKQMGVASNNIANANTVGYTRETVQATARVTAGVGSGVQDLGVVSNVDPYLQAAVMQSNSVSAQATSYNSLYQSLQQALGQITTGDTGGNDLASQLSSVQATLAQLATTPQDSSQRTKLVGQLDTFTANLRTVSTQIQQLRTTADSQISQTVADANTQLNTIAGLNAQIHQASVLGQSTASLDDQRAQALQSLTADVGVSYYTDSTGALQIATSTGQPLLIGSTVRPLVHPASTISGNSSYANGDIAGITVGGVDITTKITSGKLAALIQQRDTELPNAQSSLNYLAQNLSTALNAAHNQGTTVPPPNKLSSPAADNLNATDPVSVAAGTTVRVAVMDGSGNVQSYADIALAGAATLSDVVNDLNTGFNTVQVPAGSALPATATLSNGQFTLITNNPGQTIAISTLSGGFVVGQNQVTGGTSFPSSSNALNFQGTFTVNGAQVTVNPSDGLAAIAASITAAVPAGITVSVTADNKLVLTAPPGQSIQVAEQTGNVLSGLGLSTNSSLADMSSYLHLNDLVTGSSAATIAVRPDILANANLLSTATLNETPSPTIPFPGVTSGDGSTAQALSQALLNAQNFVANTATSTVTTSNPNQTLNLSGTFTINGGSVPVTVTVTPSMTLADVVGAVNAAANAAGAASVAASVTLSNQLQLTSGGNAISFSSVSGDVLSGLGLAGSPSGYIGASSTSFAGYATNITSDIASRASNANTAQTATQTTLAAMQSNLSSQSGVNVDEEMAQLSTLQSMYASSAKIITTVNAMFQSLLQAVGA